MSCLGFVWYVAMSPQNMQPLRTTPKPVRMSPRWEPWWRSKIPKPCGPGQRQFCQCTEMRSCFPFQLQGGRLMELESHAKRQILQGIPGRHGSWTRLNERGLRAGMLAEDEQLCYAEDVIMCDLAPTLEAVLSGHGLSGTSEHRSRLVQVQVQTPFCLWLEFPAVHRHPPAGFARVDSLPSCAPRPT